MRIRSISLKNFKQFKGENNTINFSIDPIKNVTIVKGDNRSGKTNLSQAFKWCLYEKTDLNDTDLLCKSVELQLNEDAEVSVKLNLVYNEIEYEIKRTQTFRKVHETNPSITTGSTLVMCEKRLGNTRRLEPNESTKRIREILPEDLMEYFFFSGEKMTTMSSEITSSGRNKDISLAVEAILGYGVLRDVLDHIKGYPNTRRTDSVMKKFEKQMLSKSGSETEQLLKIIDSEEGQLEAENEYLKEYKKNCGYYEQKVQSLTRRIKENENSVDLAKEQETLERSNDEKWSSIKGKVQKIKQEFGQGLKNGYFSSFATSSAIKILKNNNTLDKGVPHVHHDTIDFLFEQKQCLCGNEIDIEMTRKLNELKKFIFPESMGTSINVFLNEAQSKDKGIMLENIKDELRQIDELKNDIDDNKERLIEIERELESMDNVSKIQEELSNAKTSKEDYEKRIEDTNKKITLLEYEIANKKNKLTELNLQNNENKKVETYKAYAGYIYKKIEQAYKSQESKIREELTKTINEVFVDVFETKIRLQINEKHNVEVKLPNEEITSSNYNHSTGEGNIITLAFIAAVIKMAKADKNTDEMGVQREAYPLVMDAPFSTLDENALTKISTSIPKIAEQVVIFTKDSNMENHLGTRVGAHYSIAKRNDFESIISEVID